MRLLELDILVNAALMVVQYETRMPNSKNFQLRNSKLGKEDHSTDSPLGAMGDITEGVTRSLHWGGGQMLGVGTKTLLFS